jgi:histidine ammonia-lyase
MIQINGNRLAIEDVVSVALKGEKTELAPAAKQRMFASNSWVTEMLTGDRPIYGINTGFGIFSNKQISASDSVKLNRNLIVSHAINTGPELPDEIVRAAMLIRANTLASGYSGVRPLVVETLLEMLNKVVTPVIPSQGSLGSSGDLSPLSHLALVFTTDENDREEESGEAKYNGVIQSGKAAMEAANIERVILRAKEGLALNNGATMSAAMAALCIHYSKILLDTAAIALSMSLEALLGVSAAFDETIHILRRQRGQIAVAQRVRKMTSGSTLLDAVGRVQDAYSLRCAPQVHGPAHDTLEFVEEVISQEINAVTDNPVIIGPEIAISGGNFHGEPVGMVMDYLKIALAELGAISERRTFRLTDSHMNYGLPPMLVDTQADAGLNSGMAAPNCIHSLPTSGGKEDHNANSMTAARFAWEVMRNTAHILTVEVYCATRALDLRLRERQGAKMGIGVAVAHKSVREKIPYHAKDTYWGPEIEMLKSLILSGTLTSHVQKVLN